MQRVIIVGGGYAGTTLAQALDPTFDVVLVEPRDAFVHNVAAIRALVEADLLDKIVLPYGGLLRRGAVVRGRASAVVDGAVTLASGETLVADHVVLATGSRYAQPFKATTDATAEFRAASASTRAAIAAARSIAVVGAGAVGVELAGEIASAQPGKAITLISATPRLFPASPPGLAARLTDDLASLGVTVRTGVMATNLAATTHPFSGALTLDSGESIAADLIIPTLGTRPEAGPLAGLAGARFDAHGRVEVDSWMRPAGLARVFALGDAAANGDLMTIVASSRQAPWLAKTLAALAAGKRIEDLPAYAPWSTPPFLVPLGPRRGASVLPVTRRGLVVGPFLTRAIKGRALFIPRYRKMFGL